MAHTFSFEDASKPVTGGGDATPQPFSFEEAQGKPAAEPGGFIASAKQSIGSTIKGAGQAAADFIPGVGQDNVLRRYGQSVIDANPTAVHSLEDIPDKPGMAVKEATGNAAGSMGAMLSARLLGQGITAAAPLTGPLAPVTAAVGQGISWLGPAAAAALPSFGGIREQQIKDDPSRENDLGAKARAAAGAAAVGAIETKFGPQEWALSAISRAGRNKLAEKFAAKTMAGSVGKGLAHGAATEGAEELVQNPIEQVAAYQDPTTADNLKDTAFSGAMGAIGGGVLGGGFGGGSRLMGEERQDAAQPASASELNAAGQASPAPAPILDERALERAGVTPPPVFDEGRINQALDISAPVDPPHRALGIDPDTGPLSAGAAIAVDSGIAGQMQTAAPPEQSSPQADFDTTALFAEQSPVPLKNARRIARMYADQGSDYAVVPHPNGDGYGVAPASQLSDAQRQAFAKFQPDSGEEVAQPARGSFGQMDTAAQQITSAEQAKQAAQQAADDYANQRLAEIEQTIADNRQRQSEAARVELLHGLLADPSTTHPAERFQAELARQGYRDTALTPREEAVIQRHGEIADAFKQWTAGPAEGFKRMTGAEDLAALVGQERADAERRRAALPRQAPLQESAPPRDKVQEARELIAGGAVLQGRDIVSPSGKVLMKSLSIPQRAALRNQARTEAPSAGPQWDSLSVEDRAATAKRAGVAPVIARNIPRAEWKSLNAAVQAKLAGAMEAAPTSSAIDTAAHAAATSPHNDLAQPTDAQAKAGNYRKGHVSIDGLDVAIENPEGSTRSGTDPGGKPWSVTMGAHYGYVKRTTGADGDQVDVYIGKADPVQSPVFVVDQYDRQTGKFDEHKAILGASSLEEAQSLYDAHFSDGKGAERRGAVTPMSFDSFKDWVRNGDTTTPAGTQDAAHTPTNNEVEEPADAAKRPRSEDADVHDAAQPPDAEIGFGGITSEMEKATPSNRGALFSRGGAGIRQSDRAVYGMVAEGQSAADVLGFIRDGSRSPLNRKMARLLLKTGITPAVKLGDSKDFRFHSESDGHYSAAYVPKTDTAYLFRPHDAERHFLHEMVHAATVKALAKPGLAAMQMRHLFQHVTKIGMLKGQYGMSNVEEFVSEAFTNPSFQQALRSVPAPAGSALRSAWDALIRIVKGVLHLPHTVQDSALSAALDLGVAVMRENMALRGKEDAAGGEHAFGNVADAQAYARKATDLLNETFSVPGRLSWWHKTVGSMYNLAERSPAFKSVFDAAQGFVDDVSHYAADAADLAPKLLPKLDAWRDILKSPISAADNKAVAKPVFEGTLLWGRDASGRPVKLDELTAAAANMSIQAMADRLIGSEAISENVHKMWHGLTVDQYEANIRGSYEANFLQPGVVWSDAELRSLFGLNDKQIDLYREFRTATDRSLDTMARADMLRYGGKDAKSMRADVMAAPEAEAAAILLRDHFTELAEQEPERATALLATANGIMDRADKVKTLQSRGYAPLSRFGRYTVDVVTNGERQYFGLFETAREANRMAGRLREEFGAASVTQGTLSEESFKLFAGITPETLELFGNALGLDSTGDEARDQVFQNYLKMTKSNRSAMKRLIHRQGIAGFSEDVPRVLASFIYSNARQTAAGLNMGDLGEAVEAVPKEQGELKDVAYRLSDYVKNPQEEAQAIRGLLFAQYLGGSIASAFVNMSQPVAVTFPWLSQFGGAKQAAAQLGRAAKNLATKGYTYEPTLAKALHDAEEDGVVSPQEVHQLMAQARGSGALRAGDGTRAGEALAKASNGLRRMAFGWGKVFGMAEQVNRRVTFIAAYRTAVAQRIADPAGFARRAVIETQFNYSKANKMQWGRGAIGGTLMTFKTYSIAYLELLHRMYTQGGPDGKKAALLALGMLMLMGGAGGLPFAGDAEDLADALAQRLGYNFSTGQARQAFLADVFGDDIGNFIEHGITGLPGSPIDISGRLGMGNLIPGTGLAMAKSSHTSDVLELLGPMGDLAKRTGEAVGMLAGGDVGGAVMNVAPTAVRNLQKGLDMAATGMYRDQKGYKVLDTDALDAAVKAIGFQPHSVATIQQANSEAQQAKNFYALRAQEIRAKWAAGVFEGDQAMVQAARDEVADWNEKNPEQRMLISTRSVMKRVREMRKSKDERIAAAAPKAMRAQLREAFAQARED